MSRPSHCLHKLFPRCGCVPTPALASHLIVERDKKLAEEKAKAEAPKKPGRPKTKWQATPKKDEDDAFLENLETLLEDPLAAADLLRKVDATLCTKDFAEYCRQAWHVVEPTTKLEWNWHHELICKILQGIFEDWEHAQDDDTFIQRIR